MLRIQDDRKRDLIFARPPARIVSLVPSETETLFDLGLGDRLIARTRYCVEPAGRIDEVPVVGGTKDIDVDAIAELTPDLVLANQEENARAPLEKLAERGVPVFVSFPRGFGEGVAYVARLARLCGIEREPIAVDWVRRGYRALAELDATADPSGRPGVFLPIWMDPLMTVSGETFASDMLHAAGVRNVFADRRRRYPLAADLGRSPEVPAGDRDTRYPRVTLEEVAERAPDLVLLPDEPHPFSEDDARVFREQDTPAARTGAIRFVDGKDLFWYGTRQVAALERLRALVGELAAS